MGQILLVKGSSVFDELDGKVFRVVLQQFQEGLGKKHFVFSFAAVHLVPQGVNVGFNLVDTQLPIIFALVMFELFQLLGSLLHQNSKFVILFVPETVEAGDCVLSIFLVLYRGGNSRSVSVRLITR